MSIDRERRCYQLHPIEWEFGWACSCPTERVAAASAAWRDTRTGKI